MKRLKNILLKLIKCNIILSSTNPPLTPMKTKQVGKHVPFNKMAEKQWGFEEMRKYRPLK